MTVISNVRKIVQVIKQMRFQEEITGELAVLYCVITLPLEGVCCIVISVSVCLWDSRSVCTLACL